MHCGNVSDTPRSHATPNFQAVNAPLPILRSALSGLRNRVRERAGQWLDRARTHAGQASPVGWLDPATAMEFLSKVRDGQLPAGMELVGGQVQRLGERAFSRLITRWPALGELVAEPAKVMRRRKRTP